MADFDQPHPSDDEKAAQHVRPDMPKREGAAPEGDPNETSPGHPQHEANDPDEQDW